jgi:predicted CoA-binding protein
VNVPEPVDIVDVFRKPIYLDDIVDAAIAVGAKTLWAQLEVVSSDQEPERKVKAAGMNVVSNRCMRTEHERLQIPPKKYIHKNEQPFFESMSRVPKTWFQKGKL